jgi:hypothetical protein
MAISPTGLGRPGTRLLSGGVGLDRRHGGEPTLPPRGCLDRKRPYPGSLQGSVRFARRVVGSARGCLVQEPKPAPKLQAAPAIRRAKSRITWLGPNAIGSKVSNPKGLFAYRDLTDAVKRWSRTRRRHSEPRQPPRIIELHYDEQDAKPQPDPKLPFPVFPDKKSPSFTVLLYRCRVVAEVSLAEAESIASRPTV